MVKSLFTVVKIFARNDYSAQKAYKGLNQRINHAGRLFLRMASPVLTSPENEELFAGYDSKLWAGDSKIWILSLDLPYKRGG